MSVAVIIHERHGLWSAQLRLRLRHRPVRWFETRGRAELQSAVKGLAHPVVLIDLARDPLEGLGDLDELFQGSPAALVLLLNPQGDHEVADLARELGATHVCSGFVPPPEVARLIDRWIALAAEKSDHAGWSRPLETDALSEFLESLDPSLGIPHSPRPTFRRPRPRGNPT
jgi:DNA-binding NarL/FixJ family response regulator